MGSSTRPAPLSIGPYRSTTSPTSSSPKSPDSVMRSFSNDDMYFHPTHSRKSSSGSSSTTSSNYYDRVDRISKKPTSPTVNANSYCGRHTDQFLFGGSSPFTDLWRAIRKKD